MNGLKLLSDKCVHTARPLVTRTVHKSTFKAEPAAAEDDEDEDAESEDWDLDEDERTGWADAAKLHSGSSSYSGSSKSCSVIVFEGSEIGFRQEKQSIFLVSRFFGGNRRS